MTSPREFWKDKRVLVTGHTGFLGKTLISDLEKLQPKSIHGASRSTGYDLRNAEAWVQAYIDGGEPNIVFHLAATVSGIHSTSSYPADHIYDNVAMALGLMELARGAVDKIVVAGSVCAYPRDIEMPMMEELIWEGKPEETNFSYGESKRTLLALLQAYHQQHGTPCAYLLSANLYGPGDDFGVETRHVIPALIDKFLQGKRNEYGSVTVWGDGSASRDFLFVEDASEAYLLAAQEVDDPTPINIGSGKETTIKEVAEIVKHMTGYKGRIHYDDSMPSGQPRRVLYIARALRRMGWVPKTSVVDGIKRTVDWYEREDFSSWRQDNDVPVNG